MTSERLNPPPPTPRLHMNVSFNANSVEELSDMLLDLGNEVALREEGEWSVSSSRGWSYYTLFNPDMTPERYRTELHAWWLARKARRREAETSRAPGR